MATRLGRVRRSLGVLAASFGGLGLSGCAAPGPPLPPPRVGRVVMVHGFMDSGTVFKAMRERFERRGVKCQVVKLIPADGRGGLEKLAVGLRRDIDAEFGPSAPISIVSFSMGGLVSRYYLQQLGGAPRCENLITISSPHHGTKAACIYPTRGAREMRPGSAFLSNLAATEDRLGDMKLVSYRTPLDLVILPPTSSIWDRAVNLEYRVPLHPLMLSSKPVLEDIERRLLD